ncbi:dNTP triphosphohydrolase [Fusibacter bizertensis]|uniref:DNTP triphosphohydrolase n=1 Tax=Fusibacter bizertensis TaxID=1488331 RepID=A0ABT6NHS9_9FIRM|nr:dNTP triphosphohydrolase [Fusibacter bizertensis]MDH8679930.1 dNTP triphosphohydrolase [Fusibacter bizertensis]
MSDRGAEYIISQYKKLIDLDKRISKENKYSNQRERNPYQRDYSRILYSTSFRRLQGKMQLMSVDSLRFYRNRLTHSLEVSQIARSIAEKMREILKYEELYQKDMYVIEACSIAHDIGNPPFGHHGETVLNDLSKSFGGFEGNAQTLRILRTLEKKLPSERGLNLTIRTQFAVMKYFNPASSGKKKFIYNDDFEFYDELVNEYGVSPRTLDAQIMDLADEIAYAAHDLEDALALKLFTLDEFRYEFKHYMETKSSDETKDKILLAITKFDELVKNANEVAVDAQNIHSSEEYSHILRRELISNLVNTLVTDIGIVESNEKFRSDTGSKNDYEVNFLNYKELANGLKKFTFICINRQNNVLVYEKIGEKVLRELYQAFIDDKFNSNNMLLPAEFRADTGVSRERSVLDYLAGMMDTFAIETHKKYYGSNALEKLYP